MSSIIFMILTAVLSSACTLLVVRWWFLSHMLPLLEKQLQKRSEIIKDELSVTIRSNVKQGIMDGVSNLPSREVLRGTTRTIAKTGIEMVGGGLNTLLSRKESGETHKGEE